jgi:hypothetical protein
LHVRQRWRLRPGDLVRVDVDGASVEPGFYVPINAILEKSGATYVFVLESSEEGDRVRQVEVAVSDAVDTACRIEAVGDQPLEEGTRIAIDGALMLTDLDPVTVVSEVGGQ